MLAVLLLFLDGFFFLVMAMGNVVSVPYLKQGENHKFRARFLKAPKLPTSGRTIAL